MLIVIYFTVIVFGLLFNKSKCVALLQKACIYIVFILNNWNQDDANYRNIYNGYYGSKHEIGFDLLCQEAYSRGIAYEVFRAVFLAAAVTLLFIGIKHIFKETNNRGYSLMMLYPMLPMVELLRNFMALAIVTCGIAWYFTMEKDKLKDKIICAIVILVGASFHYSVLFFLLFLLSGEKQQTKRTYYEVAVLSIASIVVCNIPVFRRVLSIIFASEKVLSWFNIKIRIGFGVIVVFMFHILSFVIYDLTYRLYYNSLNKSFNIRVKKDKMSRLLYKLNVYSFGLMGLYTYNMEFFARIYGFVLILNCFHISYMNRRARSLNMDVMAAFQVLYHVSMFFYFCQPFNDGGIMKMILMNNALFH